MNLKHARLDNLADLNIIIGPNNCGKTSILRGIALLQRLDVGKWGNEPILCPSCASFFQSSGPILSVNCKMNDREKFLNVHASQFLFNFDIADIEKAMPDLISERNSVVSNLLVSENESKIRSEIEKINSKEKKDLTDEISLKRLTGPIHAKEKFENPCIRLKQVENYLKLEHVSFLISQRFSDEVLRTLVFCPDARLDSYKGMTVPEYIRSKNFPATEQTAMVNFLRNFVDLKLADMRQNMDLIRIVEDHRFDTTIAEQGSGVKSLICIVADILAGNPNKLLLIDEPELGLNPAGKQALLRFLLEQCSTKQVFLTTHDPTFVNPLLWSTQNVSVYLYSVGEKKFVKVNLKESKEDPSTFAGYLPHTVSLKKLHLYVEGSLDVYNFQIFLQKYLRENYLNWWEIMNSIGIFHLAGDFWSHLLFTIPDRPYLSVVILDGDKTKSARSIVEKYNQATKGNFAFYPSISDFRKLTWASRRPKVIPLPVYCLQRSEIEDYLDPKPALKENGPFVAESMTKVPEEIAELFYIVLALSDIHKTQKNQPTKV